MSDDNPFDPMMIFASMLTGPLQAYLPFFLKQMMQNKQESEPPKFAQDPEKLEGNFVNPVIGGSNNMDPRSPDYQFYQPQSPYAQEEQPPLPPLPPRQEGPYLAPPPTPQPPEQPFDWSGLGSGLGAIAGGMIDSYNQNQGPAQIHRYAQPVPTYQPWRY